MSSPPRLNPMEPDTMTRRVYNLLRAEILNGALPPGTHLVRRALAKKYGVSALPVMEACYRLENDGLVENSPMIGAHVISLSPDVTENERIFREAIECQVSREFATGAPERARGAVRELGEQVDALEEEARATGDPAREDRFQKMHQEFHLTVARLSGMDLLYREMRRIWFRRMMLICNATLSINPNPRNWHTELAAGLSHNDPDLAESRMRRHLSHNRELNTKAVQNLLNQSPGKLLYGMLNQIDTVYGKDR